MTLNFVEINIRNQRSGPDVTMTSFWDRAKNALIPLLNCMNRCGKRWKVEKRYAFQM